VEKNINVGIEFYYYRFLLDSKYVLSGADAENNFVRYRGPE
jgi:hypothetical protein